MRAISPPAFWPSLPCRAHPVFTAVLSLLSRHSVSGQVCQALHRAKERPGSAARAAPPICHGRYFAPRNKLQGRLATGKGGRQRQSPTMPGGSGGLFQDLRAGRTPERTVVWAPKQDSIPSAKNGWVRGAPGKAICLPATEAGVARPTGVRPASRTFRRRAPARIAPRATGGRKQQPWETTLGATRQPRTPLSGCVVWMLQKAH